MLKVTVCIPTYNRKHYLMEAIESVLTQSYQDFYLLVSDNGSTDGTPDMVDEYARRDARVIYNRFPRNLGSARNWRYVLTKPKTEFVAFLPDDDLWLPDHLRYAVEALEKTKESALYCCATKFFGPGKDGSLMRPWWLEDCVNRTTFDARKNFVPWLVGTPMTAASVVFRRSLLSNIVFPNEDRFSAGDWLLWGQIALRGVMVYDPVVQVRYRWHSGNDSHSTMKGARHKAQVRYTVRWLASHALEKGALNAQSMIEQVIYSWPRGPASLLTVALGTYDTPPVLRHAARQIFEGDDKIGKSSRSSRHCRIAGRIGTWYLYLADILDRIAGRWWKLSGVIKLQ